MPRCSGFRNDDSSWTSGNFTGQTVHKLAEGWATAEVKRREARAAREGLETQTCTTGQRDDPALLPRAGGSKARTAWRFDHSAVIRIDR